VVGDCPIIANSDDMTGGAGVLPARRSNRVLFSKMLGVLPSPARRFPEEGSMENISTQLERLKSPNKNTRFDACEMLRVAPSIPQEAVDALRMAAQDPDRLVAEAARDAIAVHTQPLSIIFVGRSPASAPVGFWDNPSKKLLAVALLFLATFLAVSWLNLLRWGNLQGESQWFILPAFNWIEFLPLTGDVVGPEFLVAGWSIYLFMALAVVMIDEGRVARVLYVVLAFLLLVNLVAWLQFFG
jgi:hypothetical protein